MVLTVSNRRNPMPKQAHRVLFLFLIAYLIDLSNASDLVASCPSIKVCFSFFRI